ncbi:MFS transporter [Lactobacillus sp. S2-2]|uniref:MFS transporter n=1 Tax=Lactobacillus sp. S2-2 TaxID=2692917 RepID=UPI001EFF8EC1|nr:MFS transporter [Lactobacillus sp. S2-2]MCF6514741.1 MFS transporter [Lactobacillus sp. S2-2]
MQIALLSISLVLATSLSVSAVVPKWSSAFPNFSHSSIEILVTGPSLAVIFLLFFTDELADYFGTKKVLITGLLIYGFFGTLPIIITNYWLLLFSRIMLGVGLGLINGLAVSLIGTFYDGEVKDRLMGFRSGFEMLGNAICSYLAGFLLVISNWHSIFLVYCIAFPICILVWKYLPEPEKNEAEPKISFIKKIKQISPDLIYLSIIIALYQVTYVGSTVRISEFVLQQHLGTVNDAAFIISVAPFAGLIGGILFSRIFKVFKKYIFAITLLASGIGQMIVANSKSFMMSAVGMFLITFLDTIFVSFILNQANQIKNKNSIHFNTSILLVGSNVGIFIAPILLGFITDIFNISAPINSYLLCGYSLIICGFISLLFVKRFNNK